MHVRYIDPLLQRGFVCFPHIFLHLLFVLPNLVDIIYVIAFTVRMIHVRKIVIKSDFSFI